MDPSVYVIIPSFKVKAHIKEVIEAVGHEVRKIVVVDDCCPDGSGEFVEANVTDSRVVVLRHSVNKGVGGAVITGYRYALQDGADICVKVDGDGQMNPELIPSLIAPICDRRADYVKGNRFYSLYDVSSMPKVRLFGNTVLSFMTKLTSGYWGIFDPTNGFTAIHRTALNALPLDSIDERYFFETNMLIELSGIRAVVVDMPMRAVYGDEVSGLHINEILKTFLTKHLRAVVKRVVYQYYLRDFSLASLHLPAGLLLFIFGLVVGVGAWVESYSSGVPATAGTVILAALPALLGVQFLLSFFSYDMASEPKNPLQTFDR